MPRPTKEQKEELRRQQWAAEQQRIKDWDDGYPERFHFVCRLCASLELSPKMGVDDKFRPTLEIEYNFSKTTKYNDEFLLNFNMEEWEFENHILAFNTELLLRDKERRNRSAVNDFLDKLSKEDNAMYLLLKELHYLIPSHSIKVR